MQLQQQWAEKEAKDSETTPIKILTLEWLWLSEAFDQLKKEIAFFNENYPKSEPSPTLNRITVNSKHHLLQEAVLGEQGVQQSVEISSKYSKNAKNEKEYRTLPLS